MMVDDADNRQLVERCWNRKELAIDDSKTLVVREVELLSVADHVDGEFLYQRSILLM